jgi:hypothetical protein
VSEEREREVDTGGVVLSLLAFIDLLDLENDIIVNNTNYAEREWRTWSQGIFESWNLSVLRQGIPSYSRNP